MSGLPLPGEFPYTRGITGEMYRSGLWAMVQQAGAGLPEDGNRRLLEGLSDGATLLAMWPDEPGLQGWDADDPRASGQVGLSGISLQHTGDFQRLMAGIDYSQPVFLRADETAPPLLAFHWLAARQAGIDPAGWRGVIGNDALCFRLSRRGALPIPGSMRLARDVITWATQELPAWTALSVNGGLARESGAGPAAEIAVSLAAFLEYAKGLTAQGVTVETLAQRTQISLSAGIRLLEESAKFRAARRLFASELQKRLGVTPEAAAVAIHADTTARSLAAEQPDVNLIRASVQALAAVLGGVQSLYVRGREESVAPPDKDSARLALRTQQIVGHESGVTLTMDPAGGSDYLEAEVCRLEAAAQEELLAIEADGGLAKSLEDGRLRGRFPAEPQAPVVGVTRFRMDHAEVKAPAADPAKELIQINRLRDWRASRSQTDLQRALAAIRQAASSDTALMPAIVAAAESRATLGEISETLRVSLIS